MKNLLVGACALLATLNVFASEAPSGTAPAVQATLTLEEVGNKLFARIVVTQDIAQDGTVTVKFTAPGTYCKSSSYDLKYKNKRWNTRANRTVRHQVDGQTIVCAGIWKVEVVSDGGETLATGEHEVK